MEGFEAMGLALYKDKGVVFSCFLPKKRAVGLLAARIFGCQEHHVCANLRNVETPTPHIM
jgi:hypothetical protein